jgi:hypothetical protein
MGTLIKHESPEYIALVMQQRALQAQMADILSQLEDISRALIPPVKQSRKPYDPAQWQAELDRRRSDNERQARKKSKAGTGS